MQNYNDLWCIFHFLQNLWCGQLECQNPAIIQRPNQSSKARSEYKTQIRVQGHIWGPDWKPKVSWRTKASWRAKARMEYKGQLESIIMKYRPAILQNGFSKQVIWFINRILLFSQALFTCISCSLHQTTNSPKISFWLQVCWSGYHYLLILNSTFDNSYCNSFL